MKKFLLSILCCLLAVLNGYAEEGTATLSFASTAQRTSYSITKQVWSQNKITLTNNKASSGTNVGNYYGPARFYASSNIIVECGLGNITKIVFDCNSAKYATELKNSIGSTATTSISSDKVTVTLDGSNNSFTIAKLIAQVRMDALTVTYTKAAEGDDLPPSIPTLTPSGNFVGSTTVEISCATEGAEIFYTTNGTEPTEDSEAYTGSFEITKTTTVKAIAVNDAGTSTVAEAIYTRVAAAPEISVNEDGSSESSIEVTITAAEGTETYYTLNGKIPTDKSDECPETLTLKADATLQVVAYDTEGYASSVVKQEFKLQSSGESSGAAGTATLVTDVTELAIGDQVVIVATGYNYALSTEQRTSNRGSVDIKKSEQDVELNNKVQILTLAKGANTGQFAFETGNGYLYAASTTQNHLKTTATLSSKASFTIAIENGVATIKADQNDRNWLRFNKDNDPKIFSCYSSGQADVSLYKVNPVNYEDYDLKVTKAGWATLYLGYAVTIPEDVACYGISEIEGETVSLDKITGVLPANTGVIIKADEGEYTFAVSTDKATVNTNLKGTIKNEYITNEAYVLGLDENGVVGLYKAEMNGGVFLNNANKAYLPVSALSSSAQAANGFKFRFETTGIEGVSAVKGEKVIFDLAGRKLNDMSAPGIYIVNGKKVMVK